MSRLSFPLSKTFTRPVRHSSVFPQVLPGPPLAQPMHLDPANHHQTRSPPTCPEDGYAAPDRWPFDSPAVRHVVPRGRPCGRRVRFGRSAGRALEHHPDDHDYGGRHLAERPDPVPAFPVRIVNTDTRAHRLHLDIGVAQPGCQALDGSGELAPGESRVTNPLGLDVVACAVHDHMSHGDSRFAVRLTVDDGQ